MGKRTETSWLDAGGDISRAGAVSLHHLHPGQVSGALLSFTSDLRTGLTLQAGPEVPAEAEGPDGRHHHPPLHQTRRGGVCGQRIPGVQIKIVEPHQQIKIDPTTFKSFLQNV